jgi:ligand-binding sensor domain-containing protein
MLFNGKLIQFFKVIAASMLFQILIFGIFTCKNKKNELQPTEKTTSITQAQIIFHPEAPHRITRKVKLGQNGIVLMAAYEAIIRFDGKEFINITKYAGLNNCYAFDVLQAKNGDIWIASDQKGVYVIDSSYQVSHYTAEDGVAHMRNMCIYEDFDGNIWIGGQGGLTRYNGNKFEVLTTEDGLTHNDINIITQDRTGRLWIGTRGNACIYDGISFKEIKNNNGEPFYNVWSIIEDQNGQIWLNGSGLWRYDGIQFHRVSDMEGICIYQTRSGDVLFNPGQTFNSETGLYKLTFETRSKDEPEKKALFNITGTYLGMTEDLDGNIWIGGGDGVWKYNGQEVYYFTSKMNE